MIKTSLLTFFAVVAFAQSQMKTGHEMGYGVAVLESGVTLTYKTVLEPPLKNSAFLPLGGAFGVAGNTMHHLIYDKAAQSYFGYDMAVSPAPGAKNLQVSFGPLTVSDNVRGVLKAIAGNLPLNAAPLPKYPPPQTVYEGDTIALDLMISPDGRERIVDYIQLTAPAKPGPPPAANAEPQDFSIDDGPVKFSIDVPSVLIDGQKLPDTVTMLASQGGATFWYYFPGRGRYILSLAPHAGFVKSGTVRANMIAFKADGRQYEIQLSAPIAGSDKAWNLYVLRDAAYLPQSAMLNFVVGSADRLENLLPKPL